LTPDLLQILEIVQNDPMTFIHHAATSAPSK